MIYKRVAARLKAQDWVAITIELAIVVVGVFIGVQASNYNSARNDRTLEAQYIDRIVTDLGTIASTAESQRQFEENKSRQIVVATQMTRLPPSDQKSLRLGNILTVITVRLSPNFQSPTFDDIENSGRLTLIRDAQLRESLSAYFARLQYLRAAIRLNNDSFVETYADFLRREAISAGFSDPGLATDIAMSPIDEDLSAAWRKRFGPRVGTTDNSALRQPTSRPFWERLRANLTWRGEGAIANERILELIATDASNLQREVKRREQRN